MRLGESRITFENLILDAPYALKIWRDNASITEAIAFNKSSPSCFVVSGVATTVSRYPTAHQIVTQSLQKYLYITMVFTKYFNKFQTYFRRLFWAERAHLFRVFEFDLIAELVRLLHTRSLFSQC